MINKGRVLRRAGILAIFFPFILFIIIYTVFPAGRLPPFIPQPVGHDFFYLLSFSFKSNTNFFILFEVTGFILISLSFKFRTTKSRYEIEKERITRKKSEVKEEEKEVRKINFRPIYFLIIVLIILIAYLSVNAQQSNVIITNQNQTIQNQINTINQKESDIQQKTQTISSQQSTITQQEGTITQQTQQISTLQGQISNLNTQLLTTKGQLVTTQTQLTTVTGEYDIAKNYQDRTNQAVYLSQAYVLLGKYDKVVTQVIKVFGSYPTPTTPTSDDAEIWNRAGKIYNWIGNNFKYCSDKAICISGSCWDFQFYSPNELLSGETVYLCGDCDDHAQLFAGMMYASGVSTDKVKVVCGNVGGGGHCWDAVLVNNTFYHVDTVCSNPTDYKTFFGITLSIQPASFPSGYGNVICFDKYTPTSWYTPSGFVQQ
jgi:cell division protein FtsB